MSRRSPRLLLQFVLGVFLLAPGLAAAEYRAYWAETFNTQLGTRAEIDRTIQAAVDSNANQIFAQVRRRGDSWYLDSKEPLTQVSGVCEPNASGVCTFDPLKYMVDQAHARGIELHAYVIVGSIFNAHPTITGTPRDLNHVFNQHFWQRAPGSAVTSGSQIPVTDPRNWGTRSLPHNTELSGGATTFNGQRYIAEWYVDLGHPDASAYTVDVLTHLVSKYDVDGIHLDRIRYPEAPINRPPGKPLEINVGYNETSVNRFKARFPNPAKYYQTSDIGTNVNTAAAPKTIGAGDVGYPKANDPDWNNFRREQVTNFVRRLYLSATAVKPKIKVSAALICFWTGPVGSGGWEKTEAYYRVFQDWKAWTEEGILDIVMPMAYKRENVALERAQYDDWIAFTKQLTTSSGRHSVIGLGNYLNGIEGSLVQQRKALGLPPFTSLPSASGIAYYALGSTVANTLVGNSTNAAINPNPFSYPVPNANSPKRPNEEFFSALTKGASRNALTRYEDPLLTPVNKDPVAVPDMPWKSNPTQGALMGFARNSSGNVLDGAEVRIETLDGSLVRTVKTDGGGFFGALKLAPGSYRAIATLGSSTVFACPSTVSAGLVTSSDAAPDVEAPSSSTSVIGALGLNGWYRSTVTVTLSALDACSGVTSIRRIDGGTESVAAAPVVFTAEGSSSLSFYATDRAGNRETTRTLDVKIDTGAPSITLTEPVNGAVLHLGAHRTAVYACADTASGISECTGTVANGSPLDTSSVGLKSFVVRAVDVAGNATSTEVSYRVVAPTSVSVGATPSPAVFGQLTTFSASVTATGVTTVTGGTLTFYDGSTVLGTVPVVTTLGVARGEILAALPVGSHAVTAAYSGSDNFLASRSSDFSHEVTKGATTTTLSSRSDSREVVLTAIVAAVAPAVGVPTGEVEFFEKADEDGEKIEKLKSLGRAAVVNGKAELRLRNTALKVVAQYSGSASFEPSGSSRVVHHPNN